jgi:drug/metabolite transporter (DMT)-like permease
MMVFTALLLSAWLLFHQVGAQLLGHVENSEQWKPTSFAVLCLLVAALIFQLSTMPTFFEDGDSAGSFGLGGTLKMLALIAVIATIEGYGFFNAAICLSKLKKSKDK